MATPKRLGANVDDRPWAITIDHPTDTITALDLEGDFDISLAPQLVAETDRILDQDQHLIINITDTTFIDSSTIHALFHANAAANARGRTFVLQHATAPAIERVLTITGADKQLTTAPTREQAIQHIHKHKDSWTS